MFIAPEASKSTHRSSRSEISPQVSPLRAGRIVFDWLVYKHLAPTGAKALRALRPNEIVLETWTRAIPIPDTRQLIDGRATAPTTN